MLKPAYGPFLSEYELVSMNNECYNVHAYNMRISLYVSACIRLYEACVSEAPSLSLDSATLPRQ